MIQVTLPIPPQPLWQNRRHHWTAKGAAAKKYRSNAALRAYAVRPRIHIPFVAATIAYHFHWPDAKRRDPLNAMAALKPGIDGLVDAGLLVDDDQVRPGEYTESIDRDNPRVVLTVMRADPTERAVKRPRKKSKA